MAAPLGVVGPMSVIGYSWTGCPAILACWHYRQEVGATALCAACSQFDELRVAPSPPAPESRATSSRAERSWRATSAGYASDEGFWVGVHRRSLNLEIQCGADDNTALPLSVLRSLLATVDLHIITKAEARILDELRYASITMVRDDQGSVWKMHRDDEDRVCGAEITRRATKS